MITMLVGGLWHGANWTFILWGAYHGLLLILYRLADRWWDALPALLRQFAMFLLVVLGWVLFRADNLHVASTMLTAMFTPTAGSLMSGAPLFTVILVFALVWGLFGPNPFDWHQNFHWRVRIGYGLALLFGACLAIIMGGDNSPFLYFQF